MGSNIKILFVMVVMIRVNISDIAIVAVKEVDYRCIIYDIIKSEVIHLLENSVLDDRRYIGGSCRGFPVYRWVRILGCG